MTTSDANPQNPSTAEEDQQCQDQRTPHVDSQSSKTLILDDQDPQNLPHQDPQDSLMADPEPEAPSAPSLMAALPSYCCHKMSHSLKRPMEEPSPVSPFSRKKGNNSKSYVEKPASQPQTLQTTGTAMALEIIEKLFSSGISYDNEDNELPAEVKEAFAFLIGTSFIPGGLREQLLDLHLKVVEVFDIMVLNSKEQQANKEVLEAEKELKAKREKAAILCQNIEQLERQLMTEKANLAALEKEQTYKARP